LTQEAVTAALGDDTGAIEASSTLPVEGDADTVPSIRGDAEGVFVGLHPVIANMNAIRIETGLDRNGIVPNLRR
jgi:hypothetical protein